MGLREAVVAVAALAMLVRIPLLFDRYDVAFAPDAGGYLQLADRLLAGLHFPSDYRSPGYPAFVALAHVLPGRLQDMVILLQHALGVGMAAAVVAIGWRYFGPVAGLGAGVVTAVTPILLDTEHDILPDIAFAAALLGASVLLVEAVTRHPLSHRLLIVAGVAFGATAYVKPNGQAFVVVALIPLALATRSVRRTLAGSAVFAAAVVVTLLPWIVRNGVEYGHFSFSAQGGEALFLRVFDQDRMPIPMETAEGRLASRIRAQADSEATPDNPTPGSYTPVKAALMRRGLSSSQATSVQGDLAVTAIKREPLRYAAGTARNMVLMAARSSYPRYPIFQLEQKLRPAEFPHAVAIPVWVAGAVIHLGWLLVSLGGLAVVALRYTGSRRARLAAVTFASVWLILAASVSVSNVPAHRLAAQALPLYLLLGAGGAVAAARLALARFGRPVRR
jgi:4-amino-4-deoxy-L-arabinose transferase-like glycosyltransferase